MGRNFVVLTAAGNGTRLGASTPKALVKIAGKTVLCHAVEHLPEADYLIVTAPKNHPDLPLGNKWKNNSRVVTGGATRQESVHLALETLTEVLSLVKNDDTVLVHDAARAFTPPEVFSRVLHALHDGAEAVIPVLPVTDTIKQIQSNRGDKTGLPNPLQQSQTNLAAIHTETVVKTLKRDQLRVTQTPQGFYLQNLLELHRRFSASSQNEKNSFGDDAAMAETAGLQVIAVPGDSKAFKITTPWDLRLAQSLIEKPCDN